MSKWLKILLFLFLFIISALLLNILFVSLGWSRESKAFVILFYIICGSFLILSFWNLGTALEVKYPTLGKIIHIMTILSGTASFLNMLYDIIRDIIN